MMITGYNNDFLSDMEEKILSLMHDAESENAITEVYFWGDIYAMIGNAISRNNANGEV